jgi:hypothetical protein
VWIKIAPDVWFKGLHWKSADNALSDLQSWFQQPGSRPDGKHGPWRRDDAGVAAVLATEVMKDAQPYVGLRSAQLAIHGSDVPDWQG